MNWSQFYQMSFSCTVDVKLRNFNYKYLMRIIPNNRYLFKCKLVPSVLCDFCSMQEDMLCPLNKAKVIFKGASKNQFYFPMLNGTPSFLQKYLFLLLSFQFCIIYGTCSQNVQVTSKLSPQNHFITKHILVLNQISSIIMILKYSAYMFNRYHHAYRNGLFQLITVGNSIRHKWVKCCSYKMNKF